MGENSYEGVLGLIGNTPLVHLPTLSPAGGARVYGKLEALNPAGSVKDRPALAMVERAEAEGTLKAGSVIVEATSGNTGISLAMIAAVRGYECVLVMPEDMSVARQMVLQNYGAKVLLTPAAEGMAGAVEKAGRIVRETNNAWMTRQFDNPANPDVHERTTGVEIWEQTNGVVDAFVSGVGTGGTITGVARALRKRAKETGRQVKIVAVEPRASAVISGGKPGLHGIQGLGAGFVPEVLDLELIDSVRTVSDSAAEKMKRRLSKEEGLHVGVSAGANVHAACEVARTMKPDQIVVTVLCDTGERYVC